MHSPTAAVVWEVWRHRWVLIASTAWLIVVSGLCNAISDGVIFGMTLWVHEDAILMLQLLAIGPLLCGLLPIFAYGAAADIAGKESAFPARMFTLPMTTRALVGWPMLYGASAIALAWLAVAIFVLRPGGMNVPLWWPGVFLASCLAWVQALSWRPFGLPGLRMAATILTICLLVAVTGLWMAGLPEGVFALLLGSTILPAYAVAVAGVARARRGDQPDWPRLVACARNVADWLSLRGKGFGSRSAAQVWFEWRRFGLGVLIIVGLHLLFMAVLIAVCRHNPRHAPNYPIRSPAVLLLVPLFAGLTAGGSWGTCGKPRTGQAIPAFLATRPMSCGELIWAKMKAAALSVAVVWAMTLAAVVLMLLLTRSWGELAGQWNLLTQDLSVVQKVGIVTLGSVLLLLGTWKPMVANMFVGLAGRAWVWTVAAFVMGALMVGCVFSCFLIAAHPEYHDALLAAVPWALRSAAALKLVLGAWLVTVVLRRRLIPARLMQRLLSAWLLTAVGLTGLISWLLPDGLAPWHLIAACVVLTLPLVRISLAPLALAWNRHR